jgi:hypothetical protein
VLLSGEPGTGKSRLAQTLLDWLSAEPHTRLRSFCSPHQRVAPTDGERQQGREQRRGSADIGLRPGPASSIARAATPTGLD